MIYADLGHDAAAQRQQRGGLTATFLHLSTRRDSPKIILWDIVRL
jgi:hypothetical protein